jgi:hypothetical protein
MAVWRDYPVDPRWTYEQFYQSITNLLLNVYSVEVIRTNNGLFLGSGSSPTACSRHAR